MNIPSLTCHPKIRKWADGYKDITQNFYSSFVALLSGSTFGIANSSEVFRNFTFSPSVSSMQRFLNEENISLKLNKRLLSRVKNILMRFERNPSRYILAIDDTITQHYGKRIYGTYIWHDHTKNCSLLGHRIISVGLVDTKTQLFIPLKWEILHKQTNKSDVNFENAWEVALKLIKAVLKFGFKFKTVVCDSWFNIRDFKEALIDLGLRYVIECKSNRTVIKYGNKNLKESVKEFFFEKQKEKIFYKSKKKWASSAVLTFKNFKHKVKIVAVSNRKGLEHSPFAYYETNELSWNATKVWGYSRDRWTIEVHFRDLKQNFALGEAAVRSKNSVENCLSISMIALTEIRLIQIEMFEENKSNARMNQYRRPIPASSIVNYLKVESLVSSINRLAHEKNSVYITKFKNRKHPKNYGRKPTEAYSNIRNAS